jgi:hemoglobin
METLYDAAGGREGLLRLAHAWHEHAVADPVVGHAFSHGFHPDHTARLAAYLVEALGGPPDFTSQFGDETSVVRMHSGNGPHEEMNHRAVACFDAAMDEVGLEGRVRQVLHDYWRWSTFESVNRFEESEDDVPDGLAIPRWSRDGLVEQL